MLYCKYKETLWSQLLVFQSDDILFGILNFVFPMFWPFKNLVILRHNTVKSFCVLHFNHFQIFMYFLREGSQSLHCKCGQSVSHYTVFLPFTCSVYTPLTKYKKNPLNHYYRQMGKCLPKIHLPTDQIYFPWLIHFVARFNVI